MAAVTNTRPFVKSASVLTKDMNGDKAKFLSPTPAIPVDGKKSECLLVERFSTITKTRKLVLWKQVFFSYCFLEDFNSEAVDVE